MGIGCGWMGHFNKNTYELLNLRAVNFSPVNKIHNFQCMGKIFCVEFQRYPLKFHTKYLAHTLKDMIFIQLWNFILDLRTHKRFWNAPQASDSYPFWKMACDLWNAIHNLRGLALVLFAQDQLKSQADNIDQYVIEETARLILFAVLFFFFWNCWTAAGKINVWFLPKRTTLSLW